MTRRTSIYLLVFVVLSIGAVVKATRPKGPAPITYRIPAIDPDELTKVVITQSDGTIVFERPSKDDPWKITDPLSFAADSNALKAVLRPFEKEITMDLKMSDDKESFDRYEVSPEKGITLELYQGGDLKVALVIGKSAPGGAAYIRPVNSNEVYRARVGSRARLEKKAEAWRDRHLFPFKADDVTEMHVIDEKGDRRFVREDGRWILRDSDAFDLDQRSIDGLARSAANLRAKDILDKTDDAWFASPYLRLELRAGDAHDTLIVGDEASKNVRYAKRLSDNQGFTLRQSSLGGFFKSDDDLRNKAAFSFKEDAISKVELAKGEHRLVVKKNEDSWNVEESTDGQVDDKEVRSTVTRLLRLRFAAYKPDESFPSTKPDDDSLLRITLESKDGRREGIVVAVREGENEFLAHRKGEEAVFSIRRRLLDSSRRLLGEDIPEPKRPGMPPGGRAGLPPGIRNQLPPGIKLRP